MIRIGEWNRLVVIRQKEFGVYLSDGSDEADVLLPQKQVPEGTRRGDELEVFIYRDSADRLIATLNKPLITLGELAVLKCVEVTKIGAFMDWGLEKDILLPFKEQTMRVKEGSSYLVRMYKDKSERLCVSMKIYSYLSTNSPYAVGDHVSGTIYELNDSLGAFVAVDNKYSALIPKRELHSHINVGTCIEARISEIREDGKINLTIQKPIREQMAADSEMILSIIKSYDGILPFTDKADKELIEKEFGLSKNAFKRAVGMLLKEGKIEITAKNIILKQED